MTLSQEKMLEEVHKAIVGDEDFGHVGLVKRMKSAEDTIMLYQPTIQAFVERNKESKKLRWTIISTATGLIVSIAGHISVLLNHK